MAMDRADAAAPSASGEASPRARLGPAGRVIVGGAWAGAAAGLFTALGDALSIGKRLTQFLPSLGARVHHGLYLVCLYAFVGLLLATLTSAAGWLFFRYTHAGALLRRARAAFAARRADDPLVATVLSGQVLGLLASLGVAFLLTRQIGLEFQRRFHNQALIAAYVAAVALAALLIAVVASLVLARLFEVVLRALAKGPLRRALGSPWSALALAALAGSAVVLAAVIVDYKSIMLLQLRTQVTFGFLVLLTGLAGALLSLQAAPGWLGRPSARLAWLSTGSGGVLLLVATLIFGRSQAVLKASARYSGLGGTFTRSLSKAFDFDRDGYSSVLGGGDCNDWNARIHPNADDIADNGIDENCVGGDVSAASLGVNQPYTPLPAELPKQPNVLLITIDTVRADHFGAYGYARPTSPNIDALAKRGVLFRNGFANAPSTRYSMPAIMTGRWASTVAWGSRCPFVGGCGDPWPPPISDENLMLAEALTAQGYFTAAFLNYHFFNESWGLNQGFQLYDNHRQHLHSGADPATTHGSSSEQQADVAISFLRQNADRRFFLWVHFYDPHHAYENHPSAPQFGGSELDTYDNEIAFTDQHIGRLLDVVRELGLDERTITVVTGDHGEEFGEHQVPRHGYHLYTPQTKVPFIVRVPGVQPRVVSEPVSHVDLMPTILNLVGAPPAPGPLGRSAVDLILGVAPPPGSPARGAFQEVLYEPDVTRKALATADWHLIFNQHPSPSWELYHLAEDPLEARDQSGAGGAAATAMRELRPRLERWVDVSMQLMKQRRP